MLMLQELKNYSKLLEKNPKHFGSETHVFKLYGDCLIHILEQLNLDKKPEVQDAEPFIPLMDFYAKTYICHPNSIARLLTADPEFLALCGKKTGRKYFVKPEATIRYLSVCMQPKLRNSAVRFLKMRETTKSQEQECPAQEQRMLPSFLIS